MLLFLALQGSAQFRVTFIIAKLPLYHRGTDSIYIAGNFNNWNPASAAHRLRLGDGMHGMTLSLAKGTYEFKFTRGDWSNVEAGAGGTPTNNRMLQVDRDTTIEVEIEHWADHFPGGPKRKTASANVTVIDTAFFIPQLNRHRRVWIYLPAGYANSRASYPVLYMHDGQNLFDEATAAFGEWGVDKALDTLGNRFGETIVVGIDHGGEKRINEYSPYDMARFGNGEGEAYANFLVKTLKPYIDKHYRTKRSKKFTSIAGSSMGGLISFYALMKYPRVFGAAGVFSPAFWISPEWKTLSPKVLKKIKGRVFFFAGLKEGEEMVPDMLQVFEQMRVHSKAKMKTVIRAEGRHNEATWRSEFPGFYEWLMSH